MWKCRSVSRIFPPTSPFLFGQAPNVNSLLTNSLVLVPLSALISSRRVALFSHPPLRVIQASFLNPFYLPLLRFNYVFAPFTNVTTGTLVSVAVVSATPAVAFVYSFLFFLSKFWIISASLSAYSIPTVLTVSIFFVAIASVSLSNASRSRGGRGPWFLPSVCAPVYSHRYSVYVSTLTLLPTYVDSILLPCNGLCTGPRSIYVVISSSHTHFHQHAHNAQMRHHDFALTQCTTFTHENHRTAVTVSRDCSRTAASKRQDGGTVSIKQLNSLIVWNASCFHLFKIGRARFKEVFLFGTLLLITVHRKIIANLCWTQNIGCIKAIKWIRNWRCS